MKSPLLLPHGFRLVGIMLLILFAILFTLLQFEFEFRHVFDDIPVFAIWNSGILNEGEKELFLITRENLEFEIISSLAIIGLLFVAFSKQKNEDEFLMKVRLDALLWATYFHYAILLVSLFTVYGIGFMHVLIANMFALLVIFILRFYYLLLMNAQTLQNEE
jgi:hypothetical protein